MLDSTTPRFEREKSDPDPEVSIEQDGVKKASRRQFSADYKRRILQEYDAKYSISRAKAYSLIVAGKVRVIRLSSRTLRIPAKRR